MRTNWHKALLVSFVLITSSLAGCLDNDDVDEKDMEGKYGTVMVSTYHVGQMVSAITGDTVNVEMLSQNNIPVHDYTPTLEDIVRLGEVDLFLYHGLGLEPWVGDTLDSMGSDAPSFGSTHAMPTGEVDLDYESMLIADLCELLTSGPYEDLHLSHLDDELHEFHAEKVAHALDAAEEEHEEDGHDDHDEDGHDEHDEDGHEEDGHDDHDGHEGHAHGEAEETIMNPEGCPAESVISIFHLEKGEYVIEFESEHHDEMFKLVVLKMAGGHANHDHGDHDEDGHDDHDEDGHEEEGHDGHEEEGHDDHDEDGHDEHHGECHDTTSHENYDLTEEECEAAGHVWMEEHDEDGHDEHHGECHNTTSHENYDLTEEECEAAGHVWMEEEDDDHHEEPPTPEEMMEDFDTNNDSAISWDEFWAVMGEDDDHDDNHDDHNDTHDDNDSDEEHHMECHDVDNMTHMTQYHNQTECEDAGYSWIMVEEDDHDEHSAFEEAVEEYMMEKMMIAFNDSDTDGDALLQLSELSSFIESIDVIMDSMESLSNEFMISAYDEDEDGVLSMSEFMHMMEEMEEMEDDGHDDHSEDGHDDGHDDHDGEHNETEMMELMFNMLDMNNDSYINASELGMMLEMNDDDHDDHDDHDEDKHDEDVLGYATIHIEAEGDYGFAHSTELEMFILINDNHDDHSDHDDHEEDGHDEDGHEEDGHDEDGHEEEALSYDPHSWLDPLAVKVQVDIVLKYLIETFPEGEDVFTENAEEFKKGLDKLHMEFDAALNDGVCNDKTVVANHNAYSYMAYRYDIEFITVNGLDPEGEPSPEDIAMVVEHIKKEGITVLFVEEYTDQSSVQSIVEETGVSIKILYTMEMAPSDSDDDYMSMMKKNLDNLVSGIGC
jgi:ABC-type Zn uptake system ZnuABC Zn-binding protein ZnuA